MNWISVEERLPENHDYVAVIIRKESKPKVGRYEDDWIVTSQGDDMIWEEYHDDKDITHWMPLPELPK